MLSSIACLVAQIAQFQWKLVDDLSTDVDAFECHHWIFVAQVEMELPPEIALVV